MSAIEIISRKYDGTIREVYDGRLVEVAGPLIRVQVAGGTPIYRGKEHPTAYADDAIEMYFTDRWYNVLHFLEPGSSRHLWYSNIATPAKLQGASLEWIDLDIDVCCLLDGQIQTLDIEEFEQNRIKMDYPNDVLERALASHVEVTRLGEANSFPFGRATQIRTWLDSH